MNHTKQFSDTTGASTTNGAAGSISDYDCHPLHRAVFMNDLKMVSQLLRIRDASEEDTHGNTPLHLAVMLGHRDCVHLLLAHDSSVKAKNTQGWTPLAEAISYGNRAIILSLLRKLKQQSRSQLIERRPALVAGLEKLEDFKLRLRWDFHSWVPLVSRILPSDVCRIYKRGSRIRMDTTLVDFSEMRWERGDISFLFDGRKPPGKSLLVLDNKLKVFQHVRYEESQQELEEEVDLLMSNDIVCANLSTKNIYFSRTQRGWFLKEDKTEMIGDYESDFYTAHGVFLESKKRREHLTQDDVQKNRQVMKSFTQGNFADVYETPRRDSLCPPSPNYISWDQYINSVPGEHPHLSRRPEIKTNTKHFKATVAMSSQFPMSIQSLLDVMEVIAPFKHFNKLREFMLTRLPPGFPVKIEIPVFPTISAKVSFEEFEYLAADEPTSFTVPQGYSEDPSRFPDL